MNLHLLIEFDPLASHPHYRKVKKLLRKNGIPYKTKKRAIEQGLLDSIWTEEKYIEKARELLSSYDMKHPYKIAQEGRVEKLSREFEKDWYWYLIAIFFRYLIAYPWYFLAILIVVFAMILAPFAKYGLFK